MRNYNLDDCEDFNSMESIYVSLYLPEAPFGPIDLQEVTFDGRYVSYFAQHWQGALDFLCVGWSTESSLAKEQVFAMMLQDGTKSTRLVSNTF